MTARLPALRESPAPSRRGRPCIGAQCCVRPAVSASDLEAGVCFRSGSRHLLCGVVTPLDIRAHPRCKPRRLYHFPLGRSAGEGTGDPPQCPWACLVAQLVIGLQCGRPGFDPWVEQIPWRRERLPAPGFWPGGFHGLSRAGVAENQTRLSDSHFTYFHFSSCCCRVCWASGGLDSW